jgi:hypothetical protein
MKRISPTKKKNRILPISHLLFSVAIEAERQSARHSGSRNCLKQMFANLVKPRIRLNCQRRVPHSSQFPGLCPAFFAMSGRLAQPLQVRCSGFIPASEANSERLAAPRVPGAPSMNRSLIHGWEANLPD